MSPDLFDNLQHLNTLVGHATALGRGAPAPRFGGGRMELMVYARWFKPQVGGWACRFAR
jgi:hypothetical protein